MENHSVWPPPPTSPKPISPLEKPPFSLFRFLRVPLFAVGVGLALALYDLTTAESDPINELYLGAAAVLGYSQPATFWLSAFILTACLYVVHVAAIMHGAQPPFVEPDVNSATDTWSILWPNGISGLAGAVIRYFVKRRNATD